MGGPQGSLSFEVIELVEWYLFKPLGPVLFRWKGEYSPQYKGPRVLGLSEPFPLPSTIVGALAALKIVSEGKDFANVRDPLDILGNNFNMWGPLLYLGKGKIGVHRYPGSIVILNDEAICRDGKFAIKEDNLKNPLELGMIQGRVGVKLDITGKAAIEGYLYEAAMFDIKKLQRELNKEEQNTSDVGYAINVNVNLNLKTPALIRFGGEGRLALVKKMDGSDLEKFVPKIGEQGLFMLASPALLSAEIFKSLESEMQPKVGDFEIAECKHSAHLGYINTGYDMAKNMRRPTYPALMSGSLLRGKATGTHLDPSGKHHSWGSLVRVIG